MEDLNIYSDNGDSENSVSELRSMPFSDEAEQSVLGAMIIQEIESLMSSALFPQVTFILKDIENFLKL